MTTSRSTLALALLLVTAACGAPKPETDTTNALDAVDTLKPAAVTADSLPPADSTPAVGPTGASGTRTSAATRTTTTKTRGDTTRILGRDSVIMPTGKGGLPPIKPDSL
jgi:hypothetical protein